ncbi:MAG: hypothetical protein CVV51_01185 [Spirochaetae bacterium HGW-Spirochaetae-7]|nr:MAG: hypothetical protein CVV51_01185 [Spirochaetae bacterium HGW-Spirochaetae-7]
MKRIIAIAFICIALGAPAFSDPSKAQAKGSTTTIQLAGKPADGPMGLGIFLGQPTGVTFEIDLSATSWVDFKAAWSLGGKNGSALLLQGNYEYAFPALFAIEEATFTPFFGVGAFIGVSTGDVALGVRVPGGISYRFRNFPLELFIEAGLDVYLFPAFALDGSGGLGARYRF